MSDSDGATLPPSRNKKKYAPAATTSKSSSFVFLAKSLSNFGRNNNRIGGMPPVFPDEGFSAVVAGHLPFE